MIKKIYKKDIFLKKFNTRKFLEFTLVESFVVVGVIGLLTGIVVTNVNPTKEFESSHDSVRKSDLNLINKAFVHYY